MSVTQQIVALIAVKPKSENESTKKKKEKCSQCDLAANSGCQACLKSYCKRCVKNVFCKELNCTVVTCHGCFHRAEKMLYDIQPHLQPRRPFYKEISRDGAKIVVVDPPNPQALFGEKLVFGMSSSWNMHTLKKKTVESKKCFSCDSKFRFLTKKTRCTLCLEAFCNSCVSNMNVWLEIRRLGSSKTVTVCDECRFEVWSGAAIESSDKLIAASEVLQKRRDLIVGRKLEKLFKKSCRPDLTTFASDTLSELYSTETGTDAQQLSSNLNIFTTTDSTQLVSKSAAPTAQKDSKKAKKVQLIGIEEDSEQEFDDLEETLNSGASVVFSEKSNNGHTSRKSMSVDYERPSLAAPPEFIETGSFSTKSVNLDYFVYTIPADAIEVSSLELEKIELIESPKKPQQTPLSLPKSDKKVQKLYYFTRASANEWNQHSSQTVFDRQE